MHLNLIANKYRIILQKAFPIKYYYDEKYYNSRQSLYCIRHDLVLFRLVTAYANVMHKKITWMEQTDPKLYK